MAAAVMQSCRFRVLGRLINLAKSHYPVQHVKSPRAVLHHAAILHGAMPMNVVMPALTQKMTTGTILKWFKNEGDTVIAGETLCQIQTDGSVVSMESKQSGILAKILVKENSEGVRIGTPIAYIVNSNEAVKNFAKAQLHSVSDQSYYNSGDSLHDGVPRGDLSRSYGPAVRLLLLLYNLDPTAIPSSGPRDKLLKSDVIDYITLHKLVPVISSVNPIESPIVQEYRKPTSVSKIDKRDTKETTYLDIPNSNIRQTLAKSLKVSKFNIPHSYGNAECNIDSLEKLVKLDTGAGLDVSTHEYIVKAVGVVLNRVPSVNVRWANAVVESLPQVNVNLNVSTNMGIITQIVENADVVTVEDIGRKLKEISTGKHNERAEAVGNFGIIIQSDGGVRSCTSIIKMPQCAVLAVGSPERRFSSNKWHTSVNFTLSYDSRAIDDISAAEFLHELVSVIENPLRGFLKSEFPREEDQ